MLPSWTLVFMVRILRCFVLLSGLLAAAAAIAVPRELPGYQPVAGISGNLNSMGSDSLNNLLMLWSESFQRYYPAVNIQIQGTGSSIAPTALLEGTANIGPMSRAMKAAEEEVFIRKYGYPPTAIPVAMDVIAVYVNKDNPLTAISLAQLAGVFSGPLSCGVTGAISRWGELGLVGHWQNRSFERYSRHAVSGTYGYFQQAALCGGDFLRTINEMPGSASVIKGVAGSLNGIGYAGIGFRSADVRPLAIRVDDEDVLPQPETALSGRYPLVRTLYLYVNKHPQKGLSAVEAEFLKLILSREGQALISLDGYIPLPVDQVREWREKLGLTTGGGASHEG